MDEREIFVDDVVHLYKYIDIFAINSVFYYIIHQLICTIKKKEL